MNALLIKGVEVLEIHQVLEVDLVVVLMVPVAAQEIVPPNQI